MIHGNFAWAAAAMKGRLDGESLSFEGASTDTRELKPGNLFFCLIGQRDGHDFAEAAAERGAAALVVDAKHSVTAKIPKIVVEDTLQALGDLALAWRRKFPIPLLGITGSNGKTTTKELVKSVLQTQYRTLATEGNFNNLIGVPKTLFGLAEGDQAAVVEMGMNDFGEIARLTEIAEPTLGLITNIGQAHLEKLGGLAGVVRAKGELFAGLKPPAIALVNAADPKIAALPTPAKKVCYGQPDCGIWGEVRPTPSGDDRPLHLRVHFEDRSSDLAMRIPGPHNLSNVLAALAVARELKIPFEKAKAALEAFQPRASRMELLTLASGIRLIDDCYNANPSSTVAALKTLAGLKSGQASLAILGEMLELGTFTEEG
ncbi:MAG TPA: UDP-N-acetylmuramoyl-tripeptide--D-alanyl-D-alanine ligase, partial [bacterium]|nr:UDP-N-acetylmuramoyl-tripeptide--D-alanyl-D-alanine ligase [bacterium]